MTLLAQQGPDNVVLYLDMLNNAMTFPIVAIGDDGPLFLPKSRIAVG
jgi:hypothetical protein